jgi:hypothetical protein
VRFEVKLKKKWNKVCVFPPTLFSGMREMNYNLMKTVHILQVYCITVAMYNRHKVLDITVHIHQPL